MAVEGWMGILDYEGKAIGERLWSHAVGVTNRALVTTGTDPVTGLRAREEATPGTGVAGRWNNEHFIATAKHVLVSATPSDLSFFVREHGDLRVQHASTITERDASAPIPLTDPTAVIHRCEYEDLAVITISPNAVSPLLEFFDFRDGQWVDPTEGEIVAGVGYPTALGVRFQHQIGQNIEGNIVLSPTPFTGRVLPSSTGRDFSSRFDPTQHYLTTYEPTEEGTHPSGISGAAVWIESKESQTVWAARLKFAGICTDCYQNGSVEQVIRASVVRQFLSDVFEPQQ
jgi:hypothetical protein